jgi:hypothetical protein
VGISGASIPVVSFVTIAILPARCHRRNVAVRSGLPITVIKSLIKGKASFTYALLQVILNCNLAVATRAARRRINRYVHFEYPDLFAGAQGQQGSEPPASGFLIRRFEDRYVKSGAVGAAASGSGISG